MIPGMDGLVGHIKVKKKKIGQGEREWILIGFWSWMMQDAVNLRPVNMSFCFPQFNHFRASKCNVQRNILTKKKKKYFIRDKKNS